MNIILFVGAIASLAALGRGAYRLWRAQSVKRRIRMRLQQYAGRQLFHFHLLPIRN
jgi:hypothetical protein